MSRFGRKRRNSKGKEHSLDSATLTILKQSHSVIIFTPSSNPNNSKQSLKWKQCQLSPNLSSIIVSQDGKCEQIFKLAGTMAVS